MLGDKCIEHQKDDAWDEKEECEGGHVVKLGPVFITLWTARRLAVFDRVLCQPDDWTVVHDNRKNIWKKENNRSAIKLRVGEFKWLTFAITPILILSWRITSVYTNTYYGRNISFVDYHKQ